MNAQQGRKAKIQGLVLRANYGDVDAARLLLRAS